jgi:signal transduction histidine kinase
LLTGPDDVRLWRAVAVFRVSGLAYAIALFGWQHDHYRHPGWAAAVLAGLAGWTLVITLETAWPLRATGSPGPPRSPVMAADLVVAAASVLVTRLLDRPEWIRVGAPTLPTIWVAATVLGWAVWRGRRGGLAAAVVLAACDLLEAGRPATATSTTTLNSVVLLLLTGLIVGYAVEVIRAGRAEMSVAVAVQAATAERERLARDIHDSVLQVLGLVHREGLDGAGAATPVASRLPELAGELEVRLRTLITTGPAGPPQDAGPDAEADLRATLSRRAGTRVTVSAPAQPVCLPAGLVAALDAATAAALDNVRRHAGPQARAWILLEAEPGQVTVSVRDDGPGLPPGRLEAARAEGRIGVSGSIVGRLAELGGRVEILSAPGQGTEIEMRVPTP